MQPSQTLHQSLVQDFYINHNAWLYSWLYKKIGNTSDAADLMHETYLKLLLKDNLSLILEPRAYLTTMAHALMVNHLRRSKIEKACLDAIATLPQSLIPSPEMLVITIETLTQIDQMLDGLPIKARRAFLWSQLEGVGHAEIASRLSVSVSSVRQYIAKALLHCIAVKQAE